jgi:hypothetical protein
VAPFVSVDIFSYKWRVWRGSKRDYRDKMLGAQRNNTPLTWLYQTGFL